MVTLLGTSVHWNIFARHFFVSVVEKRSVKIALRPAQKPASVLFVEAKRQHGFVQCFDIVQQRWSVIFENGR